MDADAFNVGGRQYRSNASPGNYLKDHNNQPVHGLLLYAPQWEIVEMYAEAHAAAVSIRLAFGRYPARMARFCFSYYVEMTYRLWERRWRHASG